MKQTLINAGTATEAAKVPFLLDKNDFDGCNPILRARGIGTGDSIPIWVEVAGDWVDLGTPLTPANKFREITNVGRYAITSVVATKTAVLTADIEDGVLTTLVVAEAGANYTNGTGFTFIPEGGNGDALVTYDVVLGALANVVLTNGGTGYSNVQDIVLAGGPVAPGAEGAVTAVFKANVTNGVLSNLTVTNAGSNYYNGTGFTFVPGGGNADALVTYDVVNTVISNAVLTNAGTGYNNATAQVLLGNAAAPANQTPLQASIKVNVEDGALTSLTVLEDGDNYVNGTGFTFTPTGSNAEITYNVVNNKFANVTITDAGTGFSDETDFVLLGAPAAPEYQVSTSAVFVADIVGGTLINVTLTNEGSNYQNGTGLTFIPTGGNGDALVTYDVIANSITNVVLTDGGTGYTNGIDRELGGAPLAPAAEQSVNMEMTADIVNGALTNLTVVNAGSNYQNGTGFTFTPTGGTGEITYDIVDTSVDNATISTPGTGYNDAIDVVLSGVPTPPAAEGSVNAVFKANVTNGVLSNLTVFNVGSNYDPATGVTFTPTGGNGLVTYDIVNGAVTNAVLTTPGTGYNNVTAQTLTGSPIPPANEAAVNAIFTADIEEGGLANLVVTNPGSNYDNGTGKTFTPTGGNGDSLITYDVVATSVTNAVLTTAGTGWGDEADYVLVGTPLNDTGPLFVEIESPGSL